MFARVTLFEIDTVRIGMGAALERFKQTILPDIRKQPGFRGVEVMYTDAGKGELITFWESEESAKAGLMSGFYDEQVNKFLMFTRQTPGRELYELVYKEAVPPANGATAEKVASP